MKKMRFTSIIFLIVACLSACQENKTHEAEKVVAQQETYTNPILDAGNKPWAVYHNGYYYYTQETGNNIVLWKTKDLTELRTAPQKTVWIPTKKEESNNLWAPEIHRIDGKWYIYYEADDGNSDNHQLYVIENSSEDPLEGEFVSKGRISTDKDNNWGIHPTVIKLGNELYMAWSGWQSRRVNIEQQCVYIARMKNPWTLGSDRILLSKPEYEWERQWINPDGSKTAYTIYVNEAPQFLLSKNKDKLYIFYSASGLWTPFYAVGKLTADTNSDLLNPDSWTKSEHPVFKQRPQLNIYSTGNVCFVPSPDGSETFMLYHARSIPNDPPGISDTRTPRIQKIRWDEHGQPVIDPPAPVDSVLTKPSGIV